MAKANWPLFSASFVRRFPQPVPVHSRYPNEWKAVKGLFPDFKPVLNEKDFVVEILKTVRGEGGLQNLFDADIIVSGGRGTTNDSLGLIKALAETLIEKGINAEWACSRPVVDEGVAEYARQVGQTGKTIRPKYILPSVFPAQSSILPV